MIADFHLEVRPQNYGLKTMFFDLMYTELKNCLTNKFGMIQWDYWIGGGVLKEKNKKRRKE